ncbi:phospholipase A and acyltransferase 3-like [Bradysia coprophila]|uniref:phospholipase A and acyltransferase 3-like n=1 Tax=Bradysia coprophila TaxID=38358 RepID=UPI00187DA674|nr:phospholipase A and acyltransferase 3-like [Bradysia coprophila]
MSYSGSKPSFLTYDDLIVNNLKPGDLIEIDRGNYNHWVMFVNKSENGSHWCFHVTTTSGDFEKKGAVMSSVGSVSKAIASIRKHKLKDIIEDTDSKPSKARINNKIEEANKKKCASRPIQQVIDQLEKLKDQTVPYSLTTLNCEHYVTIWKYGAGWSRQVLEKTIDIATTAAIGVATFGAVFAIVGGIFGLFSGSAKHQEYDSDSD